MQAHIFRLNNQSSQIGKINKFSYLNRMSKVREITGTYQSWDTCLNIQKHSYGVISRFIFETSTQNPIVIAPIQWRLE
jgi:hypothetical protein